MPNEHLFKRGFLIGKPGYPTTEKFDYWLAGWPRQMLGTYELRYHPLLNYHAGKTRGVAVHCLGLICDVFSKEKADADIVDELAEALARDWSAFYALLKRTGGTYLLLLEREGALYAVLDAVGTLTACHGSIEGESLLASHPRLIAEVRGDAVTRWAQEWIDNPLINRGGRSFPGLLTPYEGVEFVAPNQLFDVNRRRMHRFYPDRELTQRDRAEIVETVAPALTGQLERLAGRCRLAVSLSGGMDSRLTLAASRGVRDQASYFTYYSKNNQVLATDVEVARQLRDKFDLHHIEMLIGEYATLEDFKRQYEITTDGVQGTATTAYMMHRYLGEDYIHIRSNILETIRGFYSKNPVNRKNEFSARKLSRLFRNGTELQFSGAFEDFVEKCSFHPDRFFNFHYTDLFYWEHRLPMWLGPMIRGTRTAMDTYIIYNCRELLELMLSRPLEERNEAKLVLDLIDRLWPAVLDVPVFSGSKFYDLRAGRSYL